MLRLIGLGLITGLVQKIILDVLFSLMFRSYDPFHLPLHYIPLMLLGAVLLPLTAMILKPVFDRNREFPGRDRSFSLFGYGFLLWIGSFSLFRYLVADSEPNEWFDPSESLFVVKGLTVTSHELTLVVASMVLYTVTSIILYYREQQARYRLSMLEIESFKKSQAEYRFNMLQAQVDPHFLFNSLNTLASLVHTDQDAASDFVRKLSTVYRNVLNRSKVDLHSLAEELELLDHYTGLLQIRFKDRLVFDIQVGQEFLSYKIPPLTLQLLIENAVKHNVVSKEEPLRIRVLVEKGRLIVSNDLRRKRQLSEGSGTGLENIRNRFKMLTDKEVLIDETATEFRVEIPLIEAV